SSTAHGVRATRCSSQLQCNAGACKIAQLRFRIHLAIDQLVINRSVVGTAVGLHLIRHDEAWPRRHVGEFITECSNLLIDAMDATLRRMAKPMRAPAA